MNRNAFQYLVDFVLLIGAFYYILMTLYLTKYVDQKKKVPSHEIQNKLDVHSVNHHSF